MMKQQTSDFLLGYLFHSIERQVVKGIKGARINPKRTESKFSDAYTESIPLIWFGVKKTEQITNTLILASALCKRLDATLGDIYTNYAFFTEVVQNDCYLTFITTFEERHNLTISQIEELLGFKINIVEENKK